MKRCLVPPLAVALASLFVAGCSSSNTSGDGKPAETNVNISGGAAGGAGRTSATTTTTTTTTTAAGAPTYRVITNGISPFWNSMGKGLDQAKGTLKVNADWQGPSPADNNAQVGKMKEAIAQKVDGIAVSVIEADALAPAVDQAIQSGIPVITFDSDSPKSKRLAYIGTNNYEAGKIAGTEAAKILPAGSKLVAFVGNMSAQNARDRFNGFKDAVAPKGITFLQAPFEDSKDKNRARRNVEDALTRYNGQVNGLVGLYSYNGPAIVGAVKAANMLKKVKIICFDGEPDTLRNLKDGLVDVTVVQKPYEFGRLSVTLLNLIHKDKGIDAALKEMKPELDSLQMKINPGHVIDTGVDVVTPANAPAFLQKLKEKGLEST